jgi:hypothetical protein
MDSERQRTSGRMHMLRAQNAVKSPRWTHTVASFGISPAVKQLRKPYWNHATEGHVPLPKLLLKSKTSKHRPVTIRPHYMVADSKKQGDPKLSIED